jgi:transcriptional regulator with XRE-family HTH domain
VSNFGDLVKRLRKEKGMTLEAVARKIGSHKGYVSGIENGKVNPPSVKIIRKFARLFAQDERTLVRIAWVDKAPAIIREEARRLVALAETDDANGTDLVTVPLLNTLATGYAGDLASDGRPKPAVRASLVLPKSRGAVDFAATVCDDSMAQPGGAASFSRGDVVLLAREEKIRNGSIVYIVFTVRQKPQALVRQVMLEQGDHIVLQPLNKEYPLEFLTHDDVDAVYRVVGKVEMFEPSPVDAKV